MKSSIISEGNRVTNYGNNRFTQLNDNFENDDPLNFNDNLNINSQINKNIQLKKYEFKIIILGEYNVGKTSIIKKYVENEFNQINKTTINTNIYNKIIRMDNNTIIKLNIWDTAGEEKMNPIIKQYFKDSSGCLIVYDISNKNSFNQIEKWVNEIKENSPHYCSNILIGNKSDLNLDRKINFEEGVNLGKKYNFNFFECSAKTGNNIAIAFESLCNSIIERRNEGDIEERESIKINKTKHINKKKNKCCFL
jgi:Ras-related protein Rab-11A